MNKILVEFRGKRSLTHVSWVKALKVKVEDVGECQRRTRGAEGGFLKGTHHIHFIHPTSGEPEGGFIERKKTLNTQSLLYGEYFPSPQSSLLRIAYPEPSLSGAPRPTRGVCYAASPLGPHLEHPGSLPRPGHEPSTTASRKCVCGSSACPACSGACTAALKASGGTSASTSPARPTAPSIVVGKDPRGRRRSKTEGKRRRRHGRSF
jgi:hypothetical protein